MDNGYWKFRNGKPLLPLLAQVCEGGLPHLPLLCRPPPFSIYVVSKSVFYTRYGVKKCRTRPILCITEFTAPKSVLYPLSVLFEVEAGLRSSLRRELPGPLLSDPAAARSAEEFARPRGGDEFARTLGARLKLGLAPTCGEPRAGGRAPVVPGEDGAVRQHQIPPSHERSRS